MGAGNSGGGRWLAGEHWGLGSKLWSGLRQVRFGKHSDSTAGLRVLPGRQEVENCDYPLQGRMLSLGKGSSPMPTASLLSNQPYPSLLFTLLASHKYQGSCRGVGQGLRVD